MSALCISLGVTEVSLPRIGCGLDFLKFEDVLPRILAAFQDVAVKVNIVTPVPNIHGMAVAGDSQALRLLVARCLTSLWLQPIVSTSWLVWFRLDYHKSH